MRSRPSRLRPDARRKVGYVVLLVVTMTRALLLTLLLSPLAHAQEPPAGDDAGVEIRPADETPLDVVVFTLRTCDGVRAEAIDKRPPEVARAPAVVIELVNEGRPRVYVPGARRSRAASPAPTRSTASWEGEGGFFIAPGRAGAAAREPGRPARPPATGSACRSRPTSGLIILIGEAPPPPG
jgi:hypothetical protein